MSKSATVRLVEIAELLGVTKQRAHQIAEEKGFPAPLAEDAPGRVWSRHELQAVGEALARREALALAEELEPYFVKCRGQAGAVEAMGERPRVLRTCGPGGP